MLRSVFVSIFKIHFMSCSWNDGVFVPSSQCISCRQSMPAALSFSSLNIVFYTGAQPCMIDRHNVCLSFSPDFSSTCTPLFSKLNNFFPGDWSWCDHLSTLTFTLSCIKLATVTLFVTEHFGPVIGFVLCPIQCRPLDCDISCVYGDSCLICLRETEREREREGGWQRKKYQHISVVLVKSSLFGSALHNGWLVYDLF